MPSNFADVIKSIADELRDVASTKSIVGEPITIDGKTIIPVIKIRMGFGGGFGEDAGGDKPRGGSGSGGGGGVYVEPAAFITIEGDHISVLSPKGSKFEKLAEVVPDIVNKIMQAKEKHHEAENTEEE